MTAGFGSLIHYGKQRLLCLMNFLHEIFMSPPPAGGVCVWGGGVRLKGRVVFGFFKESNRQMFWPAVFQSVPQASGAWRCEYCMGHCSWTLESFLPLCEVCDVRVQKRSAMAPEPLLFLTRSKEGNSKDSMFLPLPSSKT